jgi:CBS domain-containing protein
MKKIPLPASPVASVRADTSIEDCVRLMRDRSIGALVILSDNIREEIVGIFTGLTQNPLGFGKERKVF